MQASGINKLFRTPWSTVLGSFLVMVIGSGPLVFVGFSVFMPAITAEFGWSRGEMSAGLFVNTIMGALAMPLIGRLIDRYGLRRTTLTGSVLFCLGLVMAFFMPSVWWVFLFIYAWLGFFGASLTPLPFAKAVSAVFDKRRGLALGLSMAGYGVGAALITALSAALIANLGWRSAYLILALIVAVVSWVSIITLIAEPPIHRANTASNQQAVEGLTVRQSLTDSANFWLIALALMLVSIAINGVISHFIVMATDRGLSMVQATSLISALGLASIVGRVMTGYLIDHFFAPRVAMAMFLLPLVGVLLLALDLPNTLLIISALGLGIGLGAEVDIMGYVAGRYFGMRAYGEIYGYLLALFTLGAGAGSYLFGYSFDLTGGYSAVLWAAVGLIAMTIAMFSVLPAYRYPPKL